MSGVRFDDVTYVGPPVEDVMRSSMSFGAIRPTFSGKETASLCALAAHRELVGVRRQGTAVPSRLAVEDILYYESLSSQVLLDENGATILHDAAERHVLEVVRGEVEHLRVP